jgi:hypothetical protein
MNGLIIKCSGCGSFWGRTDDDLKKSGKPFLTCKKCREIKAVKNKEYHAKYRQDNERDKYKGKYTEYNKVYNKEYYMNNIEQIREKQRNLDKEKRKEINKNYYLSKKSNMTEKTPEKITEITGEIIINNP